MDSITLLRRSAPLVKEPDGCVEWRNAEFVIGVLLIDYEAPMRSAGVQGLTARARSMGRERRVGFSSLIHGSRTVLSAIGQSLFLKPD
jgi:hypothetical protein